MGRFAIEQQRWPLVVVTYDGGIDDAAFEAHLSEYQSVLDRGQRYAAVFDATRAAVPPPRQRHLQAKFMDRHRATLARLCVGGGFAISSSLVRGAMTAILWLAPMPFEHVVVSTRGEAERWALERLRRAGLQAPDPSR